MRFGDAIPWCCGAVAQPWRCGAKPCMHACMHACMPSLPAFLPAPACPCMHASLPACLSSCLPAGRPACTHACMHARAHARTHAYMHARTHACRQGHACMEGHACIQGHAYRHDCRGMHAGCTCSQQKGTPVVPDAVCKHWCRNLPLRVRVPAPPCDPKSLRHGGAKVAVLAAI